MGSRRRGQVLLKSYKKTDRKKVFRGKETSGACQEPYYYARKETYYCFHDVHQARSRRRGAAGSASEDRRGRLSQVLSSL